MRCYSRVRPDRLPGRSHRLASEGQRARCTEGSPYQGFIGRPQREIHRRIRDRLDPGDPLYSTLSLYRIDDPARRVLGFAAERPAWSLASYQYQGHGRRRRRRPARDLGRPRDRDARLRRRARTISSTATSTAGGLFWAGPGQYAPALTGGPASVGAVAVCATGGPSLEWAVAGWSSGSSSGS